MKMFQKTEEKAQDEQDEEWERKKINKLQHYKNNNKT